MRLIDADRLTAHIKHYCDGCFHYNGARCRACGYGDALDAIDDAPEVDPVKHGRWKRAWENTDKEIECSLCGKIYRKSEFNYCPNCGAKMAATDTDVGGKKDGD